MTAWLPDNVQWFIAILVEELRVLETGGNVIWKNFHLIRAHDPETAYQKALEIGTRLRDEYKNSDNQTVKTFFRGIAQLLPVYEELEDGAEILFESEENVPEDRIISMAKPKEELAAFSERNKNDVAPSLN
jgi:hypothetical protein